MMIQSRFRFFGVWVLAFASLSSVHSFAATEDNGSGYRGGDWEKRDPIPVKLTRGIQVKNAIEATNVCFAKGSDTYQSLMMSLAIQIYGGQEAERLIPLEEVGSDTAKPNKYGKIDGDAVYFLYFERKLRVPTGSGPKAGNTLMHTLYISERISHSEKSRPYERDVRKLPDEPIRISVAKKLEYGADEVILTIPTIPSIRFKDSSPDGALDSFKSLDPNLIVLKDVYISKPINFGPVVKILNPKAPITDPSLTKEQNQETDYTLNLVEYANCLEQEVQRRQL